MQRDDKDIGMLMSIASSFTQLLKYIMMIEDCLTQYMLMRQAVYLICYTVIEGITLMYQCGDRLEEIVHDICTFQKEHRISDLEDEDILRVLMLINDLCDVLQLSRQKGYTALDNAFCCSEEDDNVDVMCDYIVTTYINSLRSHESEVDIVIDSECL